MFSCPFYFKLVGTPWAPVPFWLFHETHSRHGNKERPNQQKLFLSFAHLRCGWQTREGRDRCLGSQLHHQPPLQRFCTPLPAWLMSGTLLAPGSSPPGIAPWESPGYDKRSPGCGWPGLSKPVLQTEEIREESGPRLILEGEKQKSDLTTAQRAHSITECCSESKRRKRLRGKVATP